MPRHSISVKWLNLAKKLHWDMKDPDSIQRLQRYALIVMSSHPNEKARKSFLEFYFGENLGESSPSYYNHNVSNWEYIAGNMSYQESFNVSVDDTLQEYEKYTLDELKEWVRGHVINA